VVKKSDNEMEKSVNWREEIAIIAGPFGYQESRESWLAKAADKAKVTFRTVKSLFYGHHDNPSYETASKIKKAADEARREALYLAEQYQQTAGALYAKDQDFYRDDITALVDAARALRGLGVPEKEG
jgi:hypothetical protein